MKRPNQRFRHLQVRRPSDRESSGASGERPTEAGKAIADLLHVVDVPTYEARTEHVESSSWIDGFVRWLAPVVVGVVVLFGAIYGAETLARRRDVQAQHARYLDILEILRAEVSENVALDAELVRMVESVEAAVQSGQYGVSLMPLPARYAAYRWRAVANGFAQFENVALYAEIGAYYQTQPTDMDFLSYYEAAQRWRTATRGVTLQSLARTRDRALNYRVRNADREFLTAIGRLKQSLRIHRQTGEAVKRLLLRPLPIPSP